MDVGFLSIGALLFYAAFQLLALRRERYTLKADEVGKTAFEAWQAKKTEDLADKPEELRRFVNYSPTTLEAMYKEDDGSTTVGGCMAAIVRFLYATTLTVLFVYFASRADNSIYKFVFIALGVLSIIEMVMSIKVDGKMMIQKRDELLQRPSKLYSAIGWTIDLIITLGVGFAAGLAIFG